MPLFQRKKSVIATGIDTHNWYQLLDRLKADGWQVAFSYEEFDKAVDFDFYIFKKGSDKIIMGWDNWMEGEIKCSPSVMDKLSQRYVLSLSFGKPIHLTAGMIRYTLASQFVLRKLGLLSKEQR